MTPASLLDRIGWPHGRSRARCPLHRGDNDSAFSFNDETWYCFACGEGGNAWQLALALGLVDPGPERRPDRPPPEGLDEGAAPVAFRLSRTARLRIASEQRRDETWVYWNDVHRWAERLMAWGSATLVAAGHALRSQQLPGRNIGSSWQMLWERGGNLYLQGLSLRDRADIHLACDCRDYLGGMEAHAWIPDSPVLARRCMIGGLRGLECN